MTPRRAFQILTLGICLAKLAAAEDSGPLMVKIGNDQRDVYRIPAREFLYFDFVDFRLLYVDQGLLDQLVSEGAILVDTTGLRTKKEKVGIFKFTLTSTSLPTVLAELLQTTEAVQRPFPDSILVQKRLALMQAQEYFVKPGWDGATISPGDIIIFSGP